MDAGFQIESRGFGEGPTTCNGVALALVEAGELRVYLAPGEPLRLAEADVLVLGPGETALISALRSGTRGILFRARGEWLARALALAGLGLASAPPRAATLRAGTHAARCAANRLRELAAPAGEPTPEARLVRAARALELLGFTFAPGGDADDAAPRPRRSLARGALVDALAELEREPHAGASLAGLALRLGLSQRQTSRLVHERLGCSLGEHVTRLRIARAQRLLAESSLSVIDVAAEAGFGSLGHFNHVFRSRSGSTPSEFRGGARQRAHASPSVQPPASGGRPVACAGADGRDAHASPRSSSSVMASDQRANDMPPV